ncbi:unnamed protein product [Medioppia subpectinata]|uniref:Uncharacterized protein n=1 Tax=Medioppia subpectinata TaxID=1979941 RepID=A0A7R9Q3P9_9ACAR|nr:unnamed protein product [Medioppia subpectinata]CAG2111550.1 unnamed protein product [Medioppia subpectinata]
MAHNRTLTENKAPTYGTAGDPRVDFFFHVIEDTEKERTVSLLKKSWKCHPLDTLKLTAYLRDCRNGKGIKNHYQMCTQYFFEHHFETLMANMDQLVAFGYWKDPLVILMTLLFNEIPDYLAKDDGHKRRHNSQPQKKNVFPKYDRLVLGGLRKQRQKAKKEIKSNTKKATIEATKSDNQVIEAMESEDIVVPGIEVHLIGSVYQTVLNKVEALQINRKEFAQNHYINDEKYRKLYDKVVDMFANQLVTDLEKMSKDVKSLSLVGKWAPSSGHHFDKYLFICQPIAKQMLLLMKRNELIGDPKLLKDFYIKEVCTPLRRYLLIPEVFMASNKWMDIDYNRVASKCMQKNKSVFIKHDKQRFEEFLASKTTISGAVLKPVEMVERGEKYIFQTIAESEDQDFKLEMEVLEKQWLSLCEDIKKKGGGLLDNAIAVCDVSGSMNGTPMNAAIGLTILTMYLSQKPWNSMCITFDENPTFHIVDSKLTFIEKLRVMSTNSMAWGGTTNLNRVFDLILRKAVEQRLRNNQLPKVLIVFTDMEFSSAFPGTTLTNFEAAKKQFEAKGYTLPPIVFWNLRASASTPVDSNEMGVALLSGYSGQLLSLILKTEDLEKITPYSMMRSAIDDKRYSGLKIID